MDVSALDNHYYGVGRRSLDEDFGARMLNGNMMGSLSKVGILGARPLCLEKQCLLV